MRRALIALTAQPCTVLVMYILIEPRQFPEALQLLAHRAVSVISTATGLAVDDCGTVDGPVDRDDGGQVVGIVENLLDLVYSDEHTPEGLDLFLRAVLHHLEHPDKSVS